MNLYKKGFLFFLIAFTTFAQTEKNVDEQTLIWYRYMNQLELNPKWFLLSEIDYRNFVNPTVQSQYGFRTQMNIEM